MKKTKITMLLFLFIIAAKLNAQTCSSPLTREVHDNSWEFIDSTNTADTWIKFTADNNYLIFKLKIFGYSGVESFTLYQNNCSPLTVVSTTNTVSNDTLKMVTPSLTSGNDYLIKIFNPNSPSYMKYILRKFLAVSNATLLGCNTVTCSAPTGCELVCNGGFECVNQIPTTYHGINFGYCQNWVAATDGTSDLFSTLSSTVPLPCNNVGYTNPHLGNNVAGIIVNQTSSTSYYEYLETQLTSSLQAGKTYSISFWVKKGTKYPLLVNELGIFLSSSQINLTGYNLITNYSVSASNSNTAILNDYSTWQLVSYTYTAYGSEQFLTIGKTSTVTSTVIVTPPTFTQCVFSPLGNTNYLFIDDVSVKEIPTNASLSLPGNICQYQTVYLNPLATPGGGTFTGTGVTSSAGNYSFNANQNLSPGSYPIVYTFTFGTSCVQTATIGGTIVISNTVALTATASNYAICTNSSQTSSTLNVSSSYTGALTYTWLPGSANGTSLAITPSSSTVYTVSAIYSGCTYSTVVAITVNSACCTSSVAALNIGTFTSSVTYSAQPYVFNNDIVVGAGITTTFFDAEYLFAPNVKITVKNGASLVFYGCHLYGCNDMWKGIVIEDGGRVQIAGGTGTHDALFEDAIVGLDIQNHITSTISPSSGSGIIEIDKAIFNKNYIAIRINNYERDFQPYPFTIRSSVFTSRSLTFTPTSWPTCSTTSGSMREATSSTTGLTPPYSLNGTTFTVTNLKAPYSSQPSHIGIQLISVGTTTYPTTYKSIQIGSQVSVDSYNIFDGLGRGIEATNSNVYSVNNVFQNSQKYWANNYPTPPFPFGGEGLYHATPSNFNSALNLVPSGATSPTLAYLGNRFYDCHYAIYADRAYNFSCRYATFRSTQSSTNTAFGPGNTGILAKSNRMFYVIDDNSFANINTAINIPINVNSYSTTAQYFGINANCLQMNRNFIGATTTTAVPTNNEYVNKAITISAPITTSLTNVTSGNFVIKSNTITNVFRGIEINAMSKINFPVQAKTNTISLQDDGVFLSSQWGIKMSNNGAGTIRSNTIVGESTTNQTVTLLYSFYSDKDSVFCNELSTAYRGFVFEQPNFMNHWKGNKMANMERGFTIINNGIIGNQGGTGGAIDNEWNGGTWSSTNFGTFVDVGSSAAQSKLYVKTTGNYFPPNPGWDGTINSSDRYSNTANTPTTTGQFVCDDETPIANPSDIFYDLSGLTNTNHAYIGISKQYRYYLMMDEVERQAYDIYFETYGATDMGHAFEAENYIQNGDFENADKSTQDISVDNDIEYYQVTFNTIYLHQLQDSYTQEDSTSLYYIANSCPGEIGPVVYQARALYNYIYSGAFNYIDDCSTGEGRPNPIKELAKKSAGGNIELQVSMFPNPANDHITVVGKGEANENLEMLITDLAGKLILSKQIKANEKTEIDLKNGMYFVTITNSKKEKVIKKLIISK